MAVKQKVVDNVPGTTEGRLQIILRFLQEIPQQDGLQDKMCAKIVMGLGTLQVPSDPEKYIQFINDIKSIQEILAKECSNNSLIFATLEALYKEISDPQKNPSPAMSVVLQLIGVDYISTAVKWILKSGYNEQGLERALFTLCTWLSKWTWTNNLGPLVLELILGLENEHHYDMLVDVSVATIEPLFNLIILPSSRHNISPVVFSMLSKVQHKPDVFHKIIPHVKKVLACLSNEKTAQAFFCLQQIVNLCLALMEHFPGYDEQYEQLRTVLQPYCPTTNYIQLLNCKSWSGSKYISETALIGKVGLINLGNTCYMNSILQALFMTKVFQNEVLLSDREDSSLFLKMQELFALLKYSKRSSLSPSDILNLARPPGFIQGQQHDSSEYLGYLMDVLHEQEKNTNMNSPDISSCSTTPEVTIVQQVFGGRTVTIARCSDCDTSSERADNFRELQLSFPSNSESQSVQTLLDYYFQPEKLHGDNQYHCDVCGHLTDGERVTRIVDPPRRLVLTLKYFDYNHKSQERIKLRTSVKLNDYIQIEGTQYVLYSVVVHSGFCVDSGHYYTFARENDEWFKFNDSYVSKSSTEELCKLSFPATPYILFYKREDCSEPLDLEQNMLSTRLQSFLTRENLDYEMEKKQRSPLKLGSFKPNGDNDEPPPSGCGGNVFSSSSSNMFVF